MCICYYLYAYTFVLVDWLAIDPLHWFGTAFGIGSPFLNIHPFVLVYAFSGFSLKLLPFVFNMLNAFFLLTFMYNEEI